MTSTFGEMNVGGLLEEKPRLTYEIRGIVDIKIPVDCITSGPPPPIYLFCFTIEGDLTAKINRTAVFLH